MVRLGLVGLEDDDDGGDHRVPRRPTNGRKSGLHIPNVLEAAGPEAVAQRAPREAASSAADHRDAAPPPPGPRPAAVQVTKRLGRPPAAVTQLAPDDVDTVVASISQIGKLRPRDASEAAGSVHGHACPCPKLSSTCLPPHPACRQRKAAASSGPHLRPLP